MDSRKRGSAAPELLRALADIIANGSSIARLYAGLLAATLVEGNATAHALLAKELRDRRAQPIEVDDDDPPRPSLEELRRAAGRRVVREAGKR
jgi:hypothetical protein